MDANAKQTLIHRLAAENFDDPVGSKILWSRHAITEAIKDQLSRQAVEVALQTSEVIEDYPEMHRPLPDCLVLGFLSDKRPLHAVIALDEPNNRLFIVTVYVPTREKWQNDWQTRR